MKKPKCSVCGKTVGKHYWQDMYVWMTEGGKVYICDACHRKNKRK